MKLKIKKIQDRKAQTTGRVYKTVTLENEGGDVFEDVGVFDNLETLKVGATVEGEVKQSAKGYFNLQFPRKGVAPRADIKEAQDRKAASIKEAMDRKEWSILLSGAQRDAVLIVTTFYGSRVMTPGEIEHEIERWRNWFIENFDSTAQPPLL